MLTARGGEPCLADAQHAVARGLGERSWPALVARVDAIGRELLDAARAGRAEDVYRMLEAGAPPNAREPESGDSALHLAAAHGWLDTLDYLVGWMPVDKHARNAAGRTRRRGESCRGIWAQLSFAAQAGH